MRGLLKVPQKQDFLHLVRKDNLFDLPFKVIQIILPQMQRVNPLFRNAPMPEHSL